MTRRLKLFMDKDIFSNRILMLLRKNINGKDFVAKIDWVEDDESRFVRPVPMSEEKGLTLILEEDEQDKFFNQLVQDLKDMKIIDKSVEVRSLEGKLEATEKHLEDMRKLVFERK